MREKSRAFAIYCGQIMSNMNTIKINEDIFEDQIRQNNLMMSEGGAELYIEGENRGKKISNQNITGFFGISPVRKSHNKIHPVNVLNLSNQSADAGNGLHFNLVGIKTSIK